jgi:hypothetical protein
MDLSRIDGFGRIGAPTETDVEEWHRSEQLPKAQAEMLLDWLEAHGCTRRAVTCPDGRCFTVFWRS